MVRAAVTKIARAVKGALASLRERFLASRLYSDIASFDIDNRDDEKTLRSTYFSAYKRKIVIRIRSDFFTSAGLPGLILLNAKEEYNQDGITTLRHEYGHTLQVERLGAIKYGFFIFVPSMIYNLADRRRRKKGSISMYRDYFNMPWERSADALGGVRPELERAKHYRKASDKLSEVYLNAIDEFPF